MRTPLVLLVAALALPLTAATARADSMPGDQKRVSLSILVEGEVPAKRALVLANTSPGANVIEPGEAVAVEWHRADGKLQFALIDGAEAATIRKASRGGVLPARRSRDAVEAIVDAGIRCGEPFAATTTAPIDSGAVELRLIYKVTAGASDCEATLERSVYLGAEGEEIADKGDKGDAAPEEPPASAAEVAIADAPAGEAAPAAEVEGEEAIAKAGMAAKSGCGCASGAGDGRGAGWLGLAALALAVGRRRRAR
ncbi:MAG: MYXO-CTERM sorting domain-containing protein [Nannocystaceae bacterium]